MMNEEWKSLLNVADLINKAKSDGDDVPGSSDLITFLVGCECKVSWDEIADKTCFDIRGLHLFTNENSQRNYYILWNLLDCTSENLRTGREGKGEMMVKKATAIIAKYYGFGMKEMNIQQHLKCPLDALLCISAICPTTAGDPPATNRFNASLKYDFTIWNIWMVLNSAHDVMSSHNEDLKRVTMEYLFGFGLYDKCVEWDRYKSMDMAGRYALLKKTVSDFEYGQGVWDLLTLSNFSTLTGLVGMYLDREMCNIVFNLITQKTQKTYHEAMQSLSAWVSKSQVDRIFPEMKFCFEFTSVFHMLCTLFAPLVKCKNNKLSAVAHASGLFSRGWRRKSVKKKKKRKKRGSDRRTSEQKRRHKS